MNLNAQFGRHIYEREGIHVQVFKLFDLDIFPSGVLVVNHGTKSKTDFNKGRQALKPFTRAEHVFVCIFQGFGLTIIPIVLPNKTSFLQVQTGTVEGVPSIETMLCPNPEVNPQFYLFIQLCIVSQCFP